MPLVDPADEYAAKLRAAWGFAPWERVEHTLAGVHDRLLARLDPQPGDRWLDVGTGTGAVAVRAARAGANVTGLDLAEPLVETARERAAAEGLAVRFEAGTVEELPFEDAAFDKVSSSMGLIFAPRHGRAAAEVARVTRPVGKLGFSAWRPGAAFSPVMERYRPPLPPGVEDPDDWGREEHARELLGDAFDLELSDERMAFEGESAEEMWELFSTSVGPFKAMARSIGPEAAESLRADFVDFLEQHRSNGGIRLESDYLLVIGTRR